MGDIDILHTRKCFYVAGKYVEGGSQTPRGNGRVVAGQMYVEELRPATISRRYPLVFWHGACSSGACWVTTPDGRPGWASYFLAQGYVVYLVDSPERGRSAAVIETSDLLQVDCGYAEKYWTATADNGKLWANAELHTRWPGTGKMGDPTFDYFMASEVQSRRDYLATELSAKHAGVELLRKIGPAIICTHSQGGSHGWLIADSVPDLVKAIIALEPTGPPFFNHIASAAAQVDPAVCKRPYGITTVPVVYDPPLSNASELQTVTVKLSETDEGSFTLQDKRPRLLVHLSKIPVLVVTGESGYHSHYDHATVAYLRQAGVEVEHLKLSSAGIRGNGHFMFLERNCIEIAELVQQWLAKQDMK